MNVRNLFLDILFQINNLNDICTCWKIQIIYSNFFHLSVTAETTIKTQTGNNEESTFTGEEQESTFTGEEQESTFTGEEQESTSTDSGKPTTSTTSSSTDKGNLIMYTFENLQKKEKWLL